MRSSSNRGSVVYFPSGRDVNFELQINGASRRLNESVRTFASQAIAEVAPPVPTEAAKAPPARRARRNAAKAPVRPFEFTARPREPSPQTFLTAPPVLPEPETVAMAKAPPVESRVAHEVAFTYNPVRSSGIRHVIGKIPGLRALGRDNQDEEAFLPARPLRNLSPIIPPRARIPAGAEVDIKVMIDPGGAVSRYQVLSAGPDPEFARLATYAARNGRFAPARIAEKAVTSEMVLHFRYLGERRIP